jgi:hypothetical protein
MNDTSRQLIANVQNRPALARRASAQAQSRQRLLLIIVAFAVALRIASALYQGNEVRPLPGIYDQTSYDLLARRLITGHGFSFAQEHWPFTRAGEPTAHWSYLYTLYLAALYTVTGASPLLARIVQAAITGVLHCWLAWRIGQRIGGQAVGVASALLSAFYIYFFYYAGALMTESFYIIGILWTLDCALRLALSPGSEQEDARPSGTIWTLWLELGIAVGITTLLRQVFLLFVPFLYLWLGWNWVYAVRRESSSRRPWICTLLGGSLLSALMVLALIVPWTVRNYRVFHTFVPLNTNAGYAFFWGNHPIYGTSFVGILPDDGPSYQELIPPELRHLNEAELDRALLKKGLKFVFDDPVRYLQLSLSRTREYFKFWPSAQSGTTSNIARVGSFGILLPLILYGLWVSAVLAWNSRNFYQRSGFLLLGLFCFVYTTLHLLTWALIRYRLPVDAVLLIFAGTGLAYWAQRYVVWFYPHLAMQRPL